MCVPQTELLRPLTRDIGVHPQDVIRAANDARDPGLRLLTGERIWDGLHLRCFREDISRPTQCDMTRDDHVLMVHLSGVMDRLETRIEGVGSCVCPPAPGDIWLVPAGGQFRASAQGRSITYAELRILPDARVDLPSGHSRLDALEAFQGHRDEFLYRAVEQLCHWIGQEDDLTRMMAEQLTLILRQHLFARYRKAMPPRVAEPSYLTVTRARHLLAGYIEAKLDRRIRLSDLAAEVDLTVHHLLALFRESFGTTPAQYILRLRLEKARHMLLNTQEDISQVAMACGFSSHSHFSSMFKRATGLTPIQVRSKSTRRGSAMPGMATDGSAAPRPGNRIEI